MNLQSIVAALPKLSPDELRQLKARIDYLVRGPSNQASTDLANEECLYHTITENYAATSLYQLRQSGNGLYNRFKKVVSELHNACERFELNPHESRKFYKLMVHLSTISLQQYNIPVSFNSIINILNDIWHLLETSYPGYGTNPDYFREFILEPFGRRDKT